MLQNIHERARGWLAWIIVLLIATTFVIWGTESFFAGFGHSDSAATINGVDISQSQATLAYQRLRQQEQMSLGANYTATPAKEKNLKRQALEQLIVSEILSQAAKQQGFRFSQVQAANTIRSLPVFQQEGQYSPSLLQQTLANLGYSEQGFIQTIQTAMLVNEPRLGILNTAFALPSEAETLLRLVQQKRDLKYLVIAPSKPENTAIPSEAEINAYYQSHQSDFQVPEQVSIAYLQLSLADIKPSVRVSDGEVLSYYSQHQANFKQPYAQVKAKVKASLIQQKAEELFAKRSEQLANISFTNPVSLDAAASALNLSIQMSDLFAQSGSKVGIASFPQVVKAAFSPDVLTHGNNSHLIEVSPERVMVLRVAKHQAASVQPLAAVKQKIITHLQQQQALHAAEQQGKKLVEQLKQGQNLAQNWRTVSQVGRFDNRVPGPIIYHAFNAMLSNNKHLNPVGFALPDGAYAVVLVTAISDPQQLKLSDDALQLFQEQLAQALGKLEYENYVNSLRQQVKLIIRS